MLLRVLPKVLKIARFTAIAGTGIASAYIAQRKIRHGFMNKDLKKVQPLYGSIVCCDLGMAVEHSGIYVGSNCIVHLDGSGKVILSTPKKFLGRLHGLNPAMKIYVACKGANPVAAHVTGDRAMKWIEENRDYHLLFNNCHQFCRYCLTGSENIQEKIVSLTPLEKDLNTLFGFDTWCLWDMEKI